MDKSITMAEQMVKTVLSRSWHCKIWFYPPLHSPIIGFDDKKCAKVSSDNHKKVEKITLLWSEGSPLAKKLTNQSKWELVGDKI